LHDDFERLEKAPGSLQVAAVLLDQEKHLVEPPSGREVPRLGASRAVMAIDPSELAGLAGRKRHAVSLTMLLQLMAWKLLLTASLKLTVPRTMVALTM
jgi:hypothetical protein